MNMENTATSKDTSYLDVRRKSYSTLCEINEYPGM